jgi:hypothetical protein
LIVSVLNSFSPLFSQEKEQNGEESRDRSPIRSDSSPQIIEVNPPSRQDETSSGHHRQDGNDSSPALGQRAPDIRLGGFHSQEGPRSDSAPFTPPLASGGSSSSLPPGRPPSLSDLNGGRKSRDDEICIVAEKEGNRSVAAGAGRTGSGGQSEQHSLNRLHNGSLDGLERPGSGQQQPSILLHHHSSGSSHHARNSSPAVASTASNGPSKSDSPSIVKHIPPPQPQHGLSSSSSSYYGRSPHLGSDPYSRVAAGLPPSSYPLTSHHYAAPGVAAGLHDPRSLSAMMPHHAMLGASAGLARPPFDYAGMDPFRDPYRLDLLGRDPLREARERELLRLSNPLSSLMNSELERAKAMSSFAVAGYPPLSAAAAAGYPGYPSSTTLGHKLVGPPHPHHLSGLYAAGAAVPPTLGLTGPHPGLAAAHHLGLNGVPGSATAAPYGKDPMRR